MPHRAPGASGGRKGHYLSGKPIKYYRPRGSAEVRALIDDGFQAFNAARLSEACHIFTERMLAPENDTTIGITVAGALTPAGLGGCLIELMERGLVDFVISTGANLYHDLHYALNFTLRRGSPFLDDRDLYDEGVIRIYDVLFPATVLLETDAYVRDFLVRSGLDGPISTAELHLRLGEDLLARHPGCEDYSVLAAAATYGVPIYTSSPGDSSIGMNIALFHAHIGGMDTLARALLAAASILESGELDATRDERYAAWGRELGRSILDGTESLASLHERAVGAREPSRASGRQEALENLVARHVARAR